MDLTPLLSQARADLAEALGLLRDVRLVLCLGSRAQSALLLATPARILAASTTAALGLEQVRKHRPDLLMVSDRLEEGCGVDLVMCVKRHQPQLRTLLMVSREHRPDAVRRALEAGCEAIVPESRLLNGSGLQALRSVLGGGVYLDRSLAVAFAVRHQAGRRAGQEPLSARERQVLDGVVRGHTNQEIAADLMVSLDTVKTHVRNLLLKLRVQRRIQAVVIGLRRGLVDWPDP